MDRYHVALFIHILTLVIAASATAITKLAVTRRIRARTVGEALEWHGVLSSTARLFPVCLALFTITGSYMLSLTAGVKWTSGFVVAGFVGVALLLVSGVYLATKGRALQKFLEEMAKGGSDRSMPTPAGPPPFAV